MVDLFGPAPVTVQDMLGCSQRELDMRERVYPNMVRAGRMTQAESDLELKIQRAIVEHFTSLHRGGMAR
jgi:hypothetical protein